MAKINMSEFTARLMAGAQGQIKQETELEKSQRLKLEQKTEAKLAAVEQRKARYAETRKRKTAEARAKAEAEAKAEQPESRQKAVARAKKTPEEKVVANRDRVREYKKAKRQDKSKCIACHGLKVGRRSRCRACRLYSVLDMWCIISHHKAPLLAHIRELERAEARAKIEQGEAQ